MDCIKYFQRFFPVSDFQGTIMNIRILIRNVVGKGPPVHTAGLPPAADRARFAPCREAALSSPPAPGVPAREDFIFLHFSARYFTLFGYGVRVSGCKSKNNDP